MWSKFVSVVRSVVGQFPGRKPGPSVASDSPNFCPTFQYRRGYRKNNNELSLSVRIDSQWRSQGFQSGGGGGGVKGEGTGGVHPLPLGVRGLCPRKNFQITDARR
jgi:hypothetical protein